MIGIPVPSGVAFWDQRVRLDGREYTLQGRYNQRVGKWFLGLLDADGAVLHAGVKVVCHYPLFRNVVNASAPPGVLMALDTTALDPVTEGADPVLDDFGTRVVLVYVPVDEVT